MVPLDTTVQKTVAALVQDPTSAVYFIPSEPPSVLLQKFGLAVPQDAVIHSKFQVPRLAHRPLSPCGASCSLQY